MSTKKKPLTYMERITLSDKAKLSEELGYQAEDNKSQLEADLKETSRELIRQRRVLDELKSAATLDSEEILNKQDEIKGIEAGVKALEDLIAELFPV